MFSYIVKAYDVMVDGVYYNITPTIRTAIVTNGKGNIHNGSDIYTGTIKIPETIVSNGNTYKVVGIGKEAFFCSKISSIILPNSISSIGDRAFYGCTDLKTMDIPANVTSIGIYAFCDCANIRDLFIPQNVIYIGDGAFCGCNGLKSICVAKTNPKYDSRDNCNAVVETNTNTIIAGCKNTTISNTIKIIGIQAFADCKGLTTIVVPNSVTMISEGAFAESGLKEIILPNSIEYIGEYSFQNTHLRTITIPKSIIEIAKVAFSGNDSLISIYLEDGIGIINDDAFASCINLKDVYCYSETVPLTKGNGIFGGYYQDAVLHVPKKGVENYKNNIEWSRQFKEIVSIEEEGNKSSFGWILAFILFILTLLFCKKKALNRYNE